MMMRKTATLFECLITAFVLDLFINLNNFVSGDVGICVVVTEIYINSSSSFIKLGNSEGYKKTILLYSTLLACFN
jgi:hypothetical protein